MGSAHQNSRRGSSLKTTYGYDAEGHITAVSPPGQQPYLFTYGTVPGDPHAGRLIKYKRPPASTPLSSGRRTEELRSAEALGDPASRSTHGRLERLL